jgi:hypothetical protein
VLNRLCTSPCFSSPQGFDINASKVACLALAGFSLITLYWARRSWVAYATFLFTAVLIVVAWLVHHSIALRFLVLFLGVMSCLYCIVRLGWARSRSGTLSTTRSSARLRRATPACSPRSSGSATRMCGVSAARTG